MNRQCGCCWAIATMEALETKNCLVHGASAKLSVQQLVDCATQRAGYGNNAGCNGGWPTATLRYIFRAGAIARDSCYPLERQVRR